MPSPVEKERDPLAAFARIQYEFARVGLKPPEAVELCDPEEGMRLLHSISMVDLVMSPGQYGKPVVGGDGSEWMEIKVYGFKVRWPARRYALPGGGFRLG